MDTNERKFKLQEMVDEIIRRSRKYRLAIAFDDQQGGFFVSFREGGFTEQETIDLDIMVGGIDLQVDNTVSRDASDTRIYLKNKPREHYSRPTPGRFRDVDRGYSPESLVRQPRKPKRTKRK